MPFLTQMCLCSTPTTSLNSTEMDLNAPCHAPSTPAPLPGFIIHSWQNPSSGPFQHCVYSAPTEWSWIRPEEKCTSMLAVLTLNSGSAVSELSLMMSDPRQTFSIFSLDLQSYLSIFTQGWRTDFLSHGEKWSIKKWTCVAPPHILTYLHFYPAASFFLLLPYSTSQYSWRVPISSSASQISFPLIQSSTWQQDTCLIKTSSTAFLPSSTWSFSHLSLIFRNFPFFHFLLQPCPHFTPSLYLKKPWKNWLHLGSPNFCSPILLNTLH